MKVTATLAFLTLSASQVYDADLLAYAHCLGQSDGYAEDAAEYGYPAEQAYSETDAAMKRLAEMTNAVDRSSLDQARAAGKSEWDRRAAALLAAGGRMSGPAWEAHVEAANACAEVGNRLRASGVID